MFEKIKWIEPPFQAIVCLKLELRIEFQFFFQSEFQPLWQRDHDELKRNCLLGVNKTLPSYFLRRNRLHPKSPRLPVRRWLCINPIESAPGSELVPNDFNSSSF